MTGKEAQYLEKIIIDEMDEIKPLLLDELFNHKISFYSYPNGGNYREIPKKTVKHKDFKTLCEYYTKVYYTKLSNYNLRPYCYDNRIGKYVMILVADFEKYVQQFVCFVVVGKPYLVGDKK